MTQTIKIVGTPGSGKSTLAAELARRRGLDHIELDALFHLEGWTPRPIDEFQEAVRARMEAASTTGWVIDGNYRSKLGDLGDRADVIVWIDLPRSLVMRRLVRRSLGRALTGEELWNGNRERLRNLVKWDPEENILRWAWVQYPEYRRRYAASMRGRWADKETYRLRSPDEVDRFLREFAPPRP